MEEEYWDMEDPKSWLKYIGVCLLIGLVYFIGASIYDNYLSREARLTKILEKELAKEYEITPETPWKIVELEIESTTYHHRSGSKTYDCEFGLIKGYKDGYADIVGCRAPVLYSKKYKPRYNVIGIYEKKTK